MYVKWLVRYDGSRGFCCFRLCIFFRVSRPLETGDVCFLAAWVYISDLADRFVARIVATFCIVVRSTS